MSKGTTRDVAGIPGVILLLGGDAEQLSYALCLAAQLFAFEAA
jgi:hypothetical protein